MPMAIPFIVGAMAAGGMVAAGVTLGTAIMVGVTVSALASSSLMKPPSMTGVEQPRLDSTYTANPTQLTFSNNAPRRVVYGAPRVSGVVVYANIAGENNEHLYMVLALAAHRLSDVSAIYIDGEPGSLYAGFLDWWWHDGAPDQAADPTLVATFTEWTEQHRLRGIAYAVVRLKYDRKVWKNGMPRNIQFDVKGKPVYDPRFPSIAPTWSSNVALNFIDYLQSAEGLSIAADEVSWEHVTLAAEICDEVPAMAAPSLCAGRYSMNGVIELSQGRDQIINLFVSAMAGAMVYSEAKVLIFAGKGQRPVAQPITEDMLIGPPVIVPQASTDQVFNTVKGTFLDGLSKWSFNDFPPVSFPDQVAADGHEIIRDIQLPLTNDPITAQRLATIFLRRERLEGTLTLECDWSAFNYTVWDVIPINLPTLGWVNKQYQLMSWEFKFPSARSPGGVTLNLREYSPDVYSDDMAVRVDHGAGTIVVPDLSVIAAPAWVSAVSNDSTGNPTTGAPRVQARWAQSANPYCSGYQVAMVRAGAEPEELDWVQLNGAHATAHLFPATAGMSYQVYVKATSVYGTASAAAVSASVTAVGALHDRPEDVSTISLTPTGDGYRLDWAPAQNASAYIVMAQCQEQWIAQHYVESPSVLIPLLPQAVVYGVVGLSLAGYRSAVPCEVTLPAGAALPLTGTTLAELSLIDAVYTHGKLVAKSRELASAQGWETFNELVPKPVASFGAETSRTLSGVTQATPLGLAGYWWDTVPIGTPRLARPAGRNGETWFTATTTVESDARLRGAVRGDPTVHPVMALPQLYLTGQ